MLVQKQYASTGRLGDKLIERGYPLDIRYPLEEDTRLPDLNEHTGAMIFGGPMSANDDDILPGLSRQLDWIPTALDSNKPFLGICLGAQLLARTLGAQIRPHAQGIAEIGYFPVHPTPTGEAIFQDSLNVYHWHQEGFQLPTDAQLLAAGEHFPNQAFRYGQNAYGIQFHPEVTRNIMENWLSEAADKLALPGAQSVQEQRNGHQQFHEPLGDWLDSFLDLLLMER